MPVRNQRAAASAMCPDLQNSERCAARQRRLSLRSVAGWFCAEGPANCAETGVEVFWNGDRQEHIVATTNLGIIGTVFHDRLMSCLDGSRIAIDDMMFWRWSEAVLSSACLCSRLEDCWP